MESVFLTSEEYGLLGCDTVQSGKCLSPVLLLPCLTWWQSINFTTAYFSCITPFLRVGMMVSSFTLIASPRCNVSTSEPHFLSKSFCSETSAPVHRTRLCRSPGESHGQWASCQLNMLALWQRPSSAVAASGNVFVLYAVVAVGSVSRDASS